MLIPVEYVSFLVRFWREQNPRGPEPSGGWRSEVEHVQTGQHWAFGTLDELLDFLRGQADHPEALRHPAGN
jgi:hypothetical protein